MSLDLQYDIIIPLEPNAQKGVYMRGYHANPNSIVVPGLHSSTNMHAHRLILETVKTEA